MRSGDDDEIEEFEDLRPIHLDLYLSEILSSRGGIEIHAQDEAKAELGPEENEQSNPVAGGKSTFAALNDKGTPKSEVKPKRAARTPKPKRRLISSKDGLPDIVSAAEKQGITAFEALNHAGYIHSATEFLQEEAA